MFNNITDNVLITTVIYWMSGHTEWSGNFTPTSWKHIVEYNPGTR